MLNYKKRNVSLSLPVLAACFISFPNLIAAQDISSPSRLNDRSMPLTGIISAPRQKPEEPLSISDSSRVSRSVVKTDSSVSKDTSVVRQENEVFKMKRSDKIVFSIGIGVVIGVTAAVILVKLKGIKNKTESEIPDPPLPPDY